MFQHSNTPTLQYSDVFAGGFIGIVWRRRSVLLQIFLVALRLSQICDGVKQCSNTPILQHSNTPMFSLGVSLALFGAGGQCCCRYSSMRCAFLRSVMG